MPLALWRHELRAGGVILGFSEAGRRESLVLLVRESHSLPGHSPQGLHHGIVPNAEREYLRRNARLRKHSELTLPCLANPAFTGELLKLTAALPG
jgi:hypothetical protein